MFINDTLIFIFIYICSSGNDEEIENTMPPHPPTAPFSFSPGEKLFPSTPFPPFSMGNLDPAAFASKFHKEFKINSL